jgi:HTH-type transcriptional regulator/antitoxin MqsA
MENSKTMQSCDACGEGHLHPMISKKAAEYKGSHGQVVLHYSVCDVCKAELVGATESLKNKREWVRFKKAVDHIPLGAEIVEMRRKHNLSQTLAADIFGGGPVAFSKYENDDLIPDEAMVSLLKLAMTYPDTVRRLAEI